MPTKGERARAHITTAARDLFYHKGYGATSYADLADATGHAKGNIQYYFNTKDDILNAVTQARLQDYRDMLALWKKDCATAHCCLTKFIDMYANSADELSIYGCPLGTLNAELGKDHPDLQKDTRAMFDVFLHRLEAQFSRIVPKNQAKDHAEHFMVMAQGISTLSHAYRDPQLVARQTKMARQWLEGLPHKT